MVAYPKRFFTALILCYVLNDTDDGYIKRKREPLYVQKGHSFFIDAEAASFNGIFYIYITQVSF